MKDNITPAIFTFTNHVIRKSYFFEPITEQENISIDFDPSGEYNAATNNYKLILRFFASYGEKNDKYLLDITMEANFQFKENTPLDSFPDYFYPNSIAIAFPYLRAYITTVTAVANTKPLILPTLNLNFFGEPLKNNTKVV